MRTVIALGKQVLTISSITNQSNNTEEIPSISGIIASVTSSIIRKKTLFLPSIKSWINKSKLVAISISEEERRTTQAFWRREELFRESNCFSLSVIR